MKKTLLTLIICFAINNLCEAQANVYHPFPDSNAVWCQYYQGFDGMCFYGYDNSIRLISGDTTIGAFVYHRANYFSGDFSSSCSGSTQSNYWDNRVCYRQEIPQKKYIPVVPIHWLMILI